MTFTLEQVLAAARELATDSESYNNALVDLLSVLLGIPDFDQSGREAVRTQILG